MKVVKKSGVECEKLRDEKIRADAIIQCDLQFNPHNRCFSKAGEKATIPMKTKFSCVIKCEGRLMIPAIINLPSYYFARLQMFNKVLADPARIINEINTVPQTQLLSKRCK